ncbi:MAG: glycosyltransferase [Candidatus Liptonbacteria bacterium]|nr:glycosyltransferase [Candidatus Liptonbacteria bacterium]
MPDTKVPPMTIFVSGLGVNRQCGESIQAAFDELGHRTAFFGDHLGFPLEFAKLASYLPLKGTIARYYAKQREILSRKLLAAIASSHPDFVLVVGGESILPATVFEIRARFKIPVACWVMEEPAAIDVYHSTGWLNYSAYSHLFVIDELWAQSLQLFNIPKFYLPMAGDNRLYKKLSFQKDIDLLFVGSFFPDDRHIVSGFGRAILLSHLQQAGLNFKVRGDGFRKIRYFFPKLKATAPREDQLNKLYNRSKVIIYINPLLLKTDFSEPVFDIALSGNFLITDAKINTPKLFNNELVTITTARELLDTVESFLSDNNAREHISQKIRSIAFNQHTYHKRAEAILKIVA